MAWYLWGLIAAVCVGIGILKTSVFRKIMAKRKRNEVDEV